MQVFKKVNKKVFFSFNFQVRFEKVNFPSILVSFDSQADLTLTFTLALFSYIVIIRANYHAIVAARCHAFFAAACKRVSPTINHREWATNDEAGDEEGRREEKAQRCMYTCHSQAAAATCYPSAFLKK